MGLSSDNERVGALRDRLEKEVLKAVSGVRVNGGGAFRISNTTSLSFDGIEGETLTIALDLRGFAVSTGAACSSGTVDPSHVLQAMGFDPARVQGSIRVSLGKYTTEEEMLRFVEALREAVESIRSRSAGRGV
jgi:cysteine desulfurase